LQLDKYWIWKK